MADSSNTDGGTDVDDSKKNSKRLWQQAQSNWTNTSHKKHVFNSLF